MEIKATKPKLDYTKTEAANALHVSRVTIYDYIRKGLLKVNKRGRVTAKSLMEVVQ